jgi:putative transposase
VLAAVTGSAPRSPTPQRLSRPIWSSATSTRWLRTTPGLRTNTFVPTWSRIVYVAFVLDTYAADLGLARGDLNETALVLDALEQAVWLRRRDGIGDLSGLIHHNAGSQYTSIAFSERLPQVGIDPSVGSVGSAFDNARAESVIGLFKTELIKTRGPWRTVEQVEIATLEYVD